LSEGRSGTLLTGLNRRGRNKKKIPNLPGTWAGEGKTRASPSEGERGAKGQNIA